MLLLDNNLHEKRYDRKSRWTKFLKGIKKLYVIFTNSFCFSKYLVRVSMKRVLYVGGSQ